MSLLGIDIGTTGCKAGLLNEEGNLLNFAYREYQIVLLQPGWAEFDSFLVWGKVKEVITEVARSASHDPVKALCVTSCGEAMTPVSADREILGNSILGLDSRGEEYCQVVSSSLASSGVIAMAARLS